VCSGRDSRFQTNGHRKRFHRGYALGARAELAGAQMGRPGTDLRWRRKAARFFIPSSGVRARAVSPPGNRERIYVGDVIQSAAREPVAKKKTPVVCFGKKIRGNKKIEIAKWFAGLFTPLSQTGNPRFSANGPKLIYPWNRIRGGETSSFAPGPQKSWTNGGQWFCGMGFPGPDVAAHNLNSVSGLMGPRFVTAPGTVEGGRTSRFPLVAPWPQPGEKFTAIH